MRPCRHLCSRLPPAGGGARSKSATSLPTATAALGLSLCPWKLRGSGVPALLRPAMRNGFAGENGQVELRWLGQRRDERAASRLRFPNVMGHLT